MGLDTLDETKPADTDLVSRGDDEIRLTRSATKQSFAVEHYLAGQHRFLMGAASARPSAGTPGRLFINTSNNTVEYDNGSNWVATGAVVVPGSVDGSVLAANSVDSSKIVNGSILGEDIHDATITGNKIAPGAIGPGQIAGGAVGSSQLGPGAVQLVNMALGASVAVQTGFHFTAQNRTWTVGADTMVMEIPFTSRGLVSRVFMIGVFSGQLGVATNPESYLQGQLRCDGVSGSPQTGTIITTNISRAQLTGSYGTLPVCMTMIGGIELAAGGHLAKLVGVCGGWPFIQESCELVVLQWA